VSCITARPSFDPYTAVMMISESDLLCPVCDRQMRLTTVIDRSPREKTLMLQCRPCGLSTTHTVSNEEPQPLHALTS
jgi:C4-type Zn-finger protein